MLLTIIYFNLKEQIFNTKTILLGSSLPKSGIMYKWGESVEAGANAYFKYANEHQLLKDKQIELLTLDDKYEPTLTSENISQLLKKKNLFALFGFVGTPTVKNILPMIENNPIPFIAPFTGGEFLRKEYYENIINIRSSYKEEIEQLIDYLHRKKGLNKFAVFYQNDDYGEEGYVSLIHALKQYNLELIAEGTYKRNTLSIGHAFHEIQQTKPEAVIMVGAYKANAMFIKKAEQHPNFKNTLFCNLSFSDANAMVKELNYKTNNLIFSEVVPSYTNTNIPIIKEYIQRMHEYNPDIPLGFISLESFIAAKTVVMTLKNINGYITRKKFLQTIQKLPKNYLDGIHAEFKNSQLLHKTYLFEYKNNRFKEIEHE
ncbi:ABC transporter substrate-binding protein [Candidatus Marinarcus aquaticus]|nr:ABC transporter substrate-binding protein [Candidatus Marinarcus aquaticus]